MNIANEIKIVRELLGLSQQELVAGGAPDIQRYYLEFNILL